MSEHKTTALPPLTDQQAARLGALWIRDTVLAFALGVAVGAWLL